MADDAEVGYRVVVMTKALAVLFAAALLSWPLIEMPAVPAAPSQGLGVSVVNSPNLPFPKSIGKSG